MLIRRFKRSGTNLDVSGRVRVLRATWVALLVFAAMAQPTLSQTSPGTVRIAVVKSLDLPEYNLALEGFISKLTETGHEAVTLPFVLARDDSGASANWRDVRNARPDLILALGTRAARGAAEHPTDIPTVYSMVLAPPGVAPDASPPEFKNLTGATLNIPLEMQLKEIIHVFPSVRRIGVISDPSRTGPVVEKIRTLVTQRGLTLVVAWANSEQVIPDAVRRLRDSIDVLWMIPDETVLTPRSSRYIIFELIKAGVPVMGLSSAYVKAGALLALECDYTDIGRQAGELAIRVLAGQPPGRLPHTAPRTFVRALNLKVREHMRIPMDERVVEDSNVVVF
ncbi:MAG: ABC transporter substrate-binding protein [Candidatus Zixiibacteriota bacterium]